MLQNQKAIGNRMRFSQKDLQEEMENFAKNAIKSNDIAAFAKKAKWGIRIAGIICVLVGVLTRYVV